MNLFSTAPHAMRAVELIAALGVALSSVEWLRNARHLKDDALLSWPLAQLRHRFLAGRVGSQLDRIFCYPSILWLIVLRLVAAVLLAAGVSTGPARAGLNLLVALTTIAIPLRSPFGLDGADQMAAFVFGSLALARLCPVPMVEATFLWVVALQSCLSYFTAGYFKLVSPIWRSGAAIPGISATRMYGSPHARRLFTGQRGLCLALAWSVILTECIFPLGLVVPLPGLLAILCAGALFHLMSGLGMGLNTFLWSFLSTYPAVLWVHARIHS